jgi:glucose 1-dehydrogenase
MSGDIGTDARERGPQFDLTGLTAVVTGAATGIGNAIATRFAESGANVVVDYHADEDYRDASGLIETIRRAGGGASLVRADTTIEDDVDALIASAVTYYGGVDILVCNAGIEESHSVVDMPLEVWERILRVNLTGSFLCARAAARAMIARGQGGRIINISSVHEELAMPQNAAYTASKGGMRMFMRTLALELAPHAITVNNIAPGAIATRINKDVRDDPEQRTKLLREIPLGRIGDPREVAGLALYLASSAASYVTGATYVIDGGLLQSAEGL